MVGFVPLWDPCAPWVMHARVTVVAVHHATSQSDPATKHCDQANLNLNPPNPSTPPPHCRARPNTASHWQPCLGPGCSNAQASLASAQAIMNHPPTKSPTLGGLPPHASMSVHPRARKLAGPVHGCMWPWAGRGGYRARANAVGHGPT